MNAKVIARFWANVEKSDDGCWLWIGTKDGWGYGQLGIGQTHERSHRLSWQIHFGEIPAKKRIRIICRNRLCVRPDHLAIRVVTPQFGTACVEWQGARNDAGYGQERSMKLPRYVHHVAWEQVYGPIPEGMWILHRCDNPPCYNIDHLFLGTSQTNVDDMIAKGRAAWQQQDWSTFLLAWWEAKRVANG